MATQQTDALTQTTLLLQGRLGRLALAFGALLMAGIVVAGVLIAQRTSRDTADAIRSQAVRTATVDLLQAVLSAETGQRGYLLTGRPAYLEPYTDATRRVPLLLDSLERLLTGETEMARWRAVIDDKMAELAETVRLEQAGRHADALALVLTDRGKQDMQTAREIAARLTARQSEALNADLDRSAGGARLLVVVDVVALLQLALLVAVAARRLRRTMNALGLGHAALQHANALLQAGSDRLETAVTVRTAELTEANEEIQRFAYIVSHDLRAPLLNIIGFTAELTDATARLNRFVTDHLEPAGIAVPTDVREASQEDLPEAIRFIQTSTAKMDRLITAILRLSREGRRVLTPVRLDMAAVLRGIMDSVQHPATAAGAEIVLGDVPGLTSDRLAIEQVFSNLVENALKYPAAGRPGRIAIAGKIEEGAAEGAWVSYQVSDNGRGIAERDLERIFELFRRAGPQDTTGEGIGLAHVRALLRRLGGSIVCESALGVGSTFTVRLPAVLTDRHQEQANEGME